MNQTDVKIQELPDLRVASVIGYGASPEMLSIEKMVAWAKPLGLLESTKKPRLFGFNNPNPSHGTPNYGYETWLVVGKDVQASGETKIKEIPGSLCAVLYCPSVEGITATWHKLAAWVETSPYRMGEAQCLEETFFKSFEPVEVGDFNLWLPVVK